jgi:hypothetical protein
VCYHLFFSHVLKTLRVRQLFPSTFNYFQLRIVKTALDKPALGEGLLYVAPVLRS